MKQLTIFDIIQTPVKEIPCGYINEEQYHIIGRELSFLELKNMIGKKCIVSSSTQSLTGYRVIRITEYFENCDKVYKKVRELPQHCLKYADQVNGYIHDVVGQKEAMECYEEEYICDRVGYSDSDRSKSSNSWVSEMYCRNGRHEPIGGFAETFYELKEF